MTSTRREGAARFTRAARGMHEWPLVAFTGLVIPACGVFAMRLLVGLPGDEGASSVLGVFATLALLVGLAASLAHLGRPLRAPLSVRRAGRSPLSAETILAVGLLVAALLALWPELPASVPGIAATAAGVLALALLATLGLVYFLPARWPWHSALVVAPLATGLAVGAVALSATEEVQGISTAALVALLLDGLVFATAWSRRAPDGFMAVYPAIFARRHALVALRFALVNVGPAAFLLVGPPLPALLTILPGVAIDRLTFYGVAAVRSTEAEIARVERILTVDHT